MAKIVIWFYVCVSFLEMNLISMGSLVNPDWPVKGFGAVQILAGTVIVDFLSLLSLAAWLLTPREPKLREPINLNKTLEYWKFSHFIDGPYPQLSELFYVALFICMLLTLFAVPTILFFLWSDAPLPSGLLIVLRMNSLLFATGPLTLAAWSAEYFMAAIIRRFRWRGPPMNQEQLDAWKAANPDAPMPWERALNRSVVGGAAEAKKAGKSGDRI